MKLLMKSLFTFCPEAVENSKIISDRCNVKLQFTKTAYSDLIKTIENNKKNNLILTLLVH